MGRRKGRGADPSDKSSVAIPDSLTGRKGLLGPALMLGAPVLDDFQQGSQPCGSADVLAHQRQGVREGGREGGREAGRRAASVC